MFNNLYFVRHGENPANISREFSYRKIDYSLTPLGVVQAQLTAEWFKAKQIHEIYASPLKRAQETAEIIGTTLSLPVTVMEHFREVNVGLLEGQPPSQENWDFHDRIVADWYADKPETAFPGGENYVMVLDRVTAGIRHVLKDKIDKNIVVVTHEGILRAIALSLSQNVDRAVIRTTHSRNCSITHTAIVLRNGQLESRLQLWADATHLLGRDDT